MNKNALLAGDLNFLTLADVLQLLGANGVTGILRLKSKYAQDPGLIYLEKGNPINALCDSVSGVDALYSLFGWIEGEFEFSDEPVTKEKSIKKNRMEIILDGLRMLDDGKIKKPGPESIEKKSTDLTEKSSGLVIKGPLVDYMYIVDEEEFADGKEIVVEKKHGNWIWVIVEGQVDIFKKTPRGPLKLMTITDGSFIGSITSFSMDGNIRNASAIAKGNVQLGVLDTQRLSAEFSSMSPELRNFIISLDKRLKQVTESLVDIYLKKNTIEEFIKDKKPIIKQGKKEERLLTITQGEAFVVRHTDKGYVPLAHLYEGDFLGNVPFLDIGHEPYSASVFASEGLIKVKTLNQDNLQKDYNKLSSTFKKIIENLATCISATSIKACEFHKKTGKKKPLRQT